MTPLPKAEETYGFHLYGTHDKTYGIINHFPAVQVMEGNLRRLTYIVEGGLIDNRLTWAGHGQVQTAELGDYVISDMAGNYRAIEKEIFEIEFTKVV